MTVEKMVHIVAGAFILASLALAHYVNPQVAVVHRLRWREPAAERAYRLVPDEQHPQEDGSARAGRTELLNGNPEGRS